MNIISIGTILVTCLAFVAYLLVSSTCLCCIGLADMYTGKLNSNCPWHVAVEFTNGNIIRIDAIIAALKVFAIGIIINDFAIPVVQSKFFPIDEIYSHPIQ